MTDNPLREAIARIEALAAKSPGAFNRYIETHSTDPLRKDIRLIVSALSTQSTRIAALEEGLGPFAKICGIPEWSDDEKVWLSCDGASLEFLEGRVLPGVAALSDK